MKSGSWEQPRSRNARAAFDNPEAHAKIQEVVDVPELLQGLLNDPDLRAM